MKLGITPGGGWRPGIWASAAALAVLLRWLSASMISAILFRNTVYESLFRASEGAAGDHDHIHLQVSEGSELEA